MARNARSFILWLHGRRDSGPANEHIKTLFTFPEFKSTKWCFPSASSKPVTCDHGSVMPSWFDILEMPITAKSPRDETSVLKAVKNVHAMIDKEIAAGTDPDNIFICGFSQGGALALASVLLYPKTLGGGAVFSGFVPFNYPFKKQLPDDAKKTPILWLHGVDDGRVLFEAGQAGPHFLEKLGVSCEFKAYPRLGHSVSIEELAYLEAWIITRPRYDSVQNVGKIIQEQVNALNRISAKMMRQEKMKEEDTSESMMQFWKRAQIMVNTFNQVFGTEDCSGAHGGGK